MIAFYEIERPLDILGEGPRVTLGAGHYSSSDPAVQRKLRHYPGVKLLRMESESRVATAGGEPSDARPSPPAEVVVKTNPGVQMPERRPFGGRVADADRD